MEPAEHSELTALLHFLDAQRSSVLAIIEGLDDEALRTAVLPSGWTPLGLIEHLTDAEWCDIASRITAVNEIGFSV